MTRVVTEAVVDGDRLDDIVQPRDGFVLEAPTAGVAGEYTGEYTAVEGPVSHYRRRLEVTPQDDGRAHVRQEVEFRLALPYFFWLFVRPARRLLGCLGPAPMPWWAPPDRVDRRAAEAIGGICLLSMVAGYMGTILTQTITFAAEEFGTGQGAQGVALAVVRADFLITVGLVALADRRGRRAVLLATVTVACVLTATGALAPSLAWLAGSQVVTRGFVTAAGIVIAIIAVEEMPAGSRAYAVSLLTLAAAGGAGLCVMLLRLCDLAPWGWRLLYVVPLLGIPVVRHVGRALPESRRFEAPHAEAGVAGHGNRLWLLAVSAFLLAMFVTPASQFQNEYLRTERGYTAATISLFTILTGTPGFIGIVAGGRLAEHGRRLVGAVAIVVGVGSTLLVYLATGWPIWAWSLLGSIVGAAAVPALGVYGPELFPTGLRGKANGLISGAGRVGSVIGLVAVGWFADRTGRLSSGLSVLALGPALLALLVLVAYPETAHRELEDLNPEDAPPPPPASGP